jgi:hypothetical protein
MFGLKEGLAWLLAAHGEGKAADIRGKQAECDAFEPPAANGN